MPYIDAERRQTMVVAETPGELNYVLTYLVGDYIVRMGRNYTTMNAAMGALECCKLELYRRVISMYENEKILQNGDVYDERILPTVPVTLPQALEKA